MPLSYCQLHSCDGSQTTEQQSQACHHLLLRGERRPQFTDALTLTAFLPSPQLPGAILFSVSSPRTSQGCGQICAIDVCVRACVCVRTCVCVCACVRVCVLGRVYTIARPAKDQSFFFFFLIKKNNFLFCIEVELINNVVMVSGEQERDSAILIHVSILPHTYLPSIQATTQH